MTFEELIDNLDGAGLVITDPDLIAAAIKDMGYDPDQELDSDFRQEFRQCNGQ